MIVDTESLNEIKPHPLQQPDKPHKYHVHGSNPHVHDKPKRPSDKPKISSRTLQLAKQRRELAIKQVRMEKRVMLCSSLIAALAQLIWIVAISTNQWSHVESEEYSSNTGLFRVCSTAINQTNEKCSFHTLFPSRDEIAKNPSLDQHVIDYHRTSIMFSLLTLILMILCLIAAFYTFKNSRYMYKRLASGLYFITATCLLVVVEVFVTCIRYQVINVKALHPLDSEQSYGFSFYLGWTVFFVYLINSCLFLVYSRKRKANPNDASFLSS